MTSVFIVVVKKEVLQSFEVETLNREEELYMDHTSGCHTGVGGGIRWCAKPPRGSASPAPPPEFMVLRAEF